jgi:MFS family permease
MVRLLRCFCMPNIAAIWLDDEWSTEEVARAVHAALNRHEETPAFVPDSRQAWSRLALALLIASIGGVGMWSVVVVLPGVQAEFGASRGAVSLAYTLTMLGFGLGGVIVGRITDRFGIVTAMGLSIACTGIAYLLAGVSVTLWQFQAVYFLIGLGTSATFAPLMAEASHWFDRYRGIAISIVASGNYVAGTVWPPLVNLGLQQFGWRGTHVAIGLFCAVTMSLLLLVLRARMGGAGAHDHADAPPPPLRLAVSTNALNALLCIAGVACCVAMAMPQVHIVAYCGDLGYGLAHGAEMLSLMMGFGIVSRIGSGFLADRIGGMHTLLLGSLAQGFALTFYLFFDSLSSLYLISAMFGLFQGGIVPSYAIVIRETMPAREAGTRVGIVIFATVIGMSFGGWISGVIFDATGSYAAAFANGVAWNAVNLTIVLGLLMLSRRRAAIA